MKQICSRKVKVTAKYTVNKAIEIMQSAKKINSQLFYLKTVLLSTPLDYLSLFHSS